MFLKELLVGLSWVSVKFESRGTGNGNMRERELKWKRDDVGFARERKDQVFYGKITTRILLSLALLFQKTIAKTRNVHSICKKKKKRKNLTNVQ